MSTPIIIHDRLQDLFNNLGIPIEQDAEFTVHRLEDVHSEVRQSPTFRANYYSFVFLESGHSQYTLDGHQFQAKPGTVYFTNPGHLKSFYLQEQCTGYLITLSEKFLKQNVYPDVFEDFPFLLAETVPPGYLDEDTFQEYQKIVEQIADEYQGLSRYRYRIIGNLFVVLLLKIKDRFWKDYNPLRESDRGSVIVQTFKQDMEKSYRNLTNLKTLPNVQDYAQAQQLHPNYFSTVIKNKTGKSVNTWIHEKTLLEAQALLSNKSLSVKEIAYQLKFSEPTHFSKFFKKHTQQTPNNYRQSLAS
ncbi:MAG: AraC family transcriptional regulator [Cyclobacteriaceae bacterium]